jgi:ribosomal protein S7
MVWKKKKFIKRLDKKKVVYSFGLKGKIILNKFYVIWKKRFLWTKEDSLIFLKRIRKEKIIVESFFSLYKKNFLIKENLIFFNVFNDVFLKKWIFNLLKILIKNCKKKRAISFLKFIILNIKKKYSNLNIFFFNIKNNMHLPLKLRMRIVAGRKIYIPVIISEEKEIMFILRFILSSLKYRNEKNFENKLLNELFDIFENKGLSIKKKIQYNKDIKENIPNIRYLNF